MISNYVSLDLIIERLNSIKLPGQEFNIDDIKEWTWQALSKIGAVNQFIETSIKIEIVDSKGELPSNIHTLNNVLEGDSEYNMVEISPNEVFRDLTYRLNSGYIFTNFETGYVILQCYIFPIDENNKPMIPDNEYFISAVYAFIRYRLGERAFWQNKIVGQQFQWLEKEWLFYCPAALNSSKMPNEDKLFNLQKQLTNSFPNYGRSSYNKRPEFPYVVIKSNL